MTSEIKPNEAAAVEANSTMGDTVATSSAPSKATSTTTSKATMESTSTAIQTAALNPLAEDIIFQKRKQKQQLEPCSSTSKLIAVPNGSTSTVKELAEKVMLGKLERKNTIVKCKDLIYKDTNTNKNIEPTKTMSMKAIPNEIKKMIEMEKVNDNTTCNKTIDEKKNDINMNQNKNQNQNTMDWDMYVQNVIIYGQKSEDKFQYEYLSNHLAFQRPL